MSIFAKLSQYLPNLPFGKAQELVEPFFSLHITNSEIVATVWSVVNHKVSIHNSASLAYSSQNELIETANKALDHALGEELIEPQKILFGVPESWSQNDNLKEPNLKLLKRMVGEFNLSPMAFVTTSHAVSHYLQKREGIPPTVILVGIGREIEVSLVKAGKIIDSRSTQKTDHLFEDLEKTMLHFSDQVDVFPSKIWVYSTDKSTDLSKLKDELVSFPWMSNLPFLHFPKIDLFSAEDINQAIVFAGASEIDPDVNLKHSFHSSPQLTQAPKKSANLSSDNLGFVVGDINNLEEPGLDEPQMSPAVRRPHLPEIHPDQVMAATEREAQTLLHKLKGFFTNLRISPQSMALPRGRHSKLILLPLLIIGLSAAYLLLAQADVTVLVEPRVIENSAEVTADPKAKEIDEAAKIIPGKIVETSVSGEGKALATGQKKIGNPAKGKVIVYNLSNARVSYSQGTQLAASNGLKFTLDTSVQIASQSSTIGSDFTTVIKPGKSDPIGVTAVEIGPDSNLAAGSELSVNGVAKSSVVAKVDEALSGGTSKNVTVVSSDDQKKLQLRVLDELRQKAKDELQVKLNNDPQAQATAQKIIPEALTVLDGKYNYNKQVNDQASEFSLNATVRFKGVSYSDTDLKTIVGKLIQTDVPEGYQLNLQDSETQANLSKVEKDDRIVFLAKFRAKLIPNLDQEQLKTAIHAKSIPAAQRSLKEIPHVLGADIMIKPNLPGGFGFLPLLNSNINISIAAQ